LEEVVARACRAEGASAEPDAVAALVGLADGDARAVLTTLEVALALAGDRPVTLEDVEKARNSRLQHYGEDDHYDQVSAFIKSIRGSDPDAGLYWLAKMLESGEDARFIARRLVILASEDVGEADPLALVVADAAARAVEFVGLPEAQLNLAQAVVHLACAPKSNRVTVALGRARRDVLEGPRGEVPTHLRDAHYRSAAKIGHGEGYVYPHDEPGAWADQRYRPVELGDAPYYEPSDRGHEAVVGERLRRWRGGGAPPAAPGADDARDGDPGNAPQDARDGEPPTGSPG
jgi:putative ATPase